MEARIGPRLITAGAKYESQKLEYTQERTYLADFVLQHGTIIEVKGLFTSADRTKMLAVKRAHPDADIRFVLATPNAYLTKAKRLTQGQWCNRHGFPYAHNDVPASWLS